MARSPSSSDVNLDVRPGEVVALLGENGAGKSTLASIISGLVRPTIGSMTWRGQAYAPDAPADALSAGIGLIHQEMRLLRDLSIAENVFVGRLPMRGGRIDREFMNRRAAEQLHRLGLDASPTTLVRDLRVAAQQQVEIAKALTLNARLLIFDEPTAALGAEETERLFEQIGRLKSEGVSFIYISHRLDEIARIADRVVVLRDGQARRDPRYRAGAGRRRWSRRWSAGRSTACSRISPSRPAAAPLIEVEGLTSAEGAFADVSFSVRPGEVFGVAGIVGAGRTELMRAIAGADPIAAGRVKVNGDVLRLSWTARRPRSRGCPRSRGPQGAGPHPAANDRRESRARQLSARRAVRLGHHRAHPGLRRERHLPLPHQGDRIAARQRTLSGGNQQKVVIAKSILREPKVVILDEPTRGIDVGARAAIYEIIADLARAAWRSSS